MDEKTEELIALIAKEHGVVLDVTDPILVVPTMLRFMLEESRENQQELLDELKSELQSSLMQWDFTAKDKADRILNAALKANREAMEQVLKSAASQTTDLVRQAVADELNKSRAESRNAKRLVMWNVFASVITLAAAAVAFVTTFWS
ncbi:conjugal transfer protein TraM [Citrobacter freundii]|uniref:conjugal transfer protein TraM n=1 Tax=Citrobacter freundii TaxID=546 RepID=UPI00174D0436|nr:conjugal transfer protein TraM [Citrobacter freundii]EAT2029970.1 conjugal transfer protein TraM [Salmonella enterica]MBD5662162.1 conjugal transfer protein TraM [Citrobacter freundii]